LKFFFKRFNPPVPAFRVELQPFEDFLQSFEVYLQKFELFLQKFHSKNRSGRPDHPSERLKNAFLGYQPAKSPF
jgi:hypothetical protein